MSDQMLARQLATQMSRSHAHSDSQNDFIARDFIINGRFMVDGAGRVVKELSFPAVFLDEPLFFCGGVLEANQSLSPDHYPELSAVVVDWVEERKGINTTLYRGCRLAVLTRGASDQRMWVNWHFIGTALVNPIGGSTTTAGSA